MKNKELKAWNGRGWGQRKYDANRKIILDPTGIKYCDHALVIAYSRAEAVRLINKATNRERVNDNELKVYWHNDKALDYKHLFKDKVPEPSVWTKQDINDEYKRIM